MHKYIVSTLARGYDWQPVSDIVIYLLNIIRKDILITNAWQYINLDGAKLLWGEEEYLQ